MKRWAAVFGAVALFVAGCDSAASVPFDAPQHHPATARPHQPSTSPTPSTVGVPTVLPPVRESLSPTPTRPTKTATSPVSTTKSTRATGPKGIVGHERVVAYYGVPGNPQLGVLGSGSPERVAQAVIKRAAAYRGYGEPVCPALELITTVAQGAPGRDHTYSKAIPASEIRQYLDVVHRHHMLLVLDLQPGRAAFLSQAEQMTPFLRDPSVGLALDPEWKVTRGAPGGGRIGSSSAQGINAVGRYLSRLVRANHLPPKMLLVHQFTRSMLPDRSRITQHTGVQMVLHADGFGTREQKIRVFRDLRFPHPPFGIGFKLFLQHDTKMMSARQVMQLRPRPDVITYQ